MEMSLPPLPGGILHRAGAMLSQDLIEWTVVVFKDPPAIGTTLCAPSFPLHPPLRRFEMDQEGLQKLIRAGEDLYVQFATVL